MSPHGTTVRAGSRFPTVRAERPSPPGIRARGADRRRYSITAISCSRGTRPPRSGSRRSFASLGTTRLLVERRLNVLGAREMRGDGGTHLLEQPLQLGVL